MEIIRIPRSLILNTDLGDKRIIVFAAILFSKWNGTDIAQLIRYCGYGTDRTRGGTTDQIKSLVKKLFSGGYLSTGVTSNQRDFFALITLAEFQKILTYREQRTAYGKRINHAHILLLLAYVRCHMFRNCEMPRMYSNLYIRISENIGISVRSISNAVKILEWLGILHCEELPRYKDGNENWHSNVKVFVDQTVDGLPEYDYQKETERAVSYLLSCQTN